MAENTMTAVKQGRTGTADGLRRSPAAHLAEMMAEASSRGDGSMALREVAFAVQVGLRAQPGSESARALESVLGVRLPTGHGQVTGDAAGQHVLWLSPDEFLAVDVSRQQSPGDTQELEDALDGRPGQAVDLSANRTILELAGAKARQVLEKGCHADLHPRAFPTGSAIVTQVGLVPVILHRSAEDEFRLYPRSSFADFLVRWLVDAMEEFAHEEVL